MIAIIRDLITKTSHAKYVIELVIFVTILTFYLSNSLSKENKSSADSTSNRLTSSEVIYRNPRVYNVDYSFELVPDPAKVDRAKDLKLWVPIPREWDSQKAVKIISVRPPPHAEYEDPEYGNRMFFWDFGKDSEKPSYSVDIKFHLESYEIHAEVDPEHIGPYDKTSKEYALYTRSTHTVSITLKIREMAQEAVGDEKNPYLQAKRIFEFVKKKVKPKILDFERGRGIKCLLDYPVIDEETGAEYYEGSCSQYSALFIALCRAVGIPARMVGGFIGWRPWIKAEDLKLGYKFETKLSPEGLAGAQHYTSLIPHGWAEFNVPNYG
jgi:transglutaminase-like putative cysteine protease